MIKSDTALPTFNMEIKTRRHGEKHHLGLFLLLFLPLVCIKMNIATMLRSQQNEVYPGAYEAVAEQPIDFSVMKKNRRDTLSRHKQSELPSEALGAKSSSIAVSDEKKKTTRIIGFSDGGYKEIAWKWYQRLEELGYNEHLVIAQDRISGDYFKEKGIRHDLMYHWSNTSLRDECTELQEKNQTYRRSLFATRWHYVARLLKQGHHVLLTDVDNVFVRYHPMSQLEESPYDTNHAYAGTVPSFPKNVFRGQGFTICGGMSWLRSTPSVIKLVHALLDRCGCRKLGCTCHCDDQVALNTFYYKGGSHEVTWDQPPLETPNSTDFMSWEGRTGICKKTGHRVKVWDRHLAYRGFIDTDPCPNESNWIAMPQGKGLDRATVWESWKAKCWNNRTNAAA